MTEDPSDTVAHHCVGRHDITAFADAIGTTHPAHRDVAAARALGHRDVIAPPTFVAALALRAERDLLADPTYGLDLSRLLHREVRVVTMRPVAAGDVLNLRVRVAEVESLPRLVRVVTKIDVSACDGPVAQVWSTVVVFSRRPQ